MCEVAMVEACWFVLYSMPKDGCKAHAATRHNGIRSSLSLGRDKRTLLLTESSRSWISITSSAQMLSFLDNLAPFVVNSPERLIGTLTKSNDFANSRDVRIEQLFHMDEIQDGLNQKETGM